MTKAETAILKALKEVAKMINACEDIDVKTVKIPPKSSIEDAAKKIEDAIEEGMGGMEDVDLFPDDILEKANAISDQITELKKATGGEGEEFPKNDKITDVDLIEEIPENENEPTSETADPFTSQGETTKSAPTTTTNTSTDGSETKKKRGPKKAAAKKPDKNEKDRLISTLFSLLPAAQVDNLKPEDMRGILKAML